MKTWPPVDQPLSPISIPQGFAVLKQRRIVERPLA